MQYKLQGGSLWRERKVTRRNRMIGLAFISPWIVGFLAFNLYPTIASLYYSFTEYNVLNPPQWTGLGNYAEMFTDDPLFWRSLSNTMYYIVFALPLGMVVSVTLAMLLNTKIRGLAVYRTIFYLPTIVPAVASTILWMWLLDANMGIINTGLGLLGITGPGWLSDPAWFKPALILMSVWGVGGSVVIYLAGLQDVPAELYESAELDGASWWRKTWNITLPMISPVIFFNLVMGLINALQFFTEIYIMTLNKATDSTVFYSVYMFKNAFKYYHMGYASAQAWVLFAVILGVTLLVFKTSGRWVYYAGDK